ncbi:hypothetical protein LCGC14_1125870 [marine sediment metagenome]|uniref:Uncharacterized protein n=2 Tax=root TaxID=1 RepID=A0A831QMW7_9FLAO|nr:hypothetical protein [Pricia antarctica]
MKSFRKRNDNEDRIQEKTIIVGEIKLTTKQQARLYTQSERSHYFRDKIKDIVSSLIDESYECEKMFWNDVARVCGYKSTFDASIKDGIHLRVDWLKGVIEKRKLKETD